MIKMHHGPWVTVVTLLLSILATANADALVDGGANQQLAGRWVPNLDETESRFGELDPATREVLSLVVMEFTSTNLTLLAHDEPVRVSINGEMLTPNESYELVETEDEDTFQLIITDENGLEHEDRVYFLTEEQILLRLGKRERPVVLDRMPGEGYVLEVVSGDGQTYEDGSLPEAMLIRIKDRSRHYVADLEAAGLSIDVSSTLPGEYDTPFYPVEVEDKVCFAGKFSVPSPSGGPHNLRLNVNVRKAGTVVASHSFVHLIGPGAPERPMESTPPSSTAVLVESETLLRVIDQGFMRCGIIRSFLEPFHRDIARALSVVALDSPDHIEFVPFDPNGLSDYLMSREIDFAVGLSRDGIEEGPFKNEELGLRFGPAYFVGGKGFLVWKDLGLISPKELDGAYVGLRDPAVVPSVEGFFESNGMSYDLMVAESVPHLVETYKAGGCDAIAGATYELEIYQRLSGAPDSHMILPVESMQFSMSTIVLEGDDHWANLMTWCIHAVIRAEELGITSNNVADLASYSDDPEIKEFLNPQRAGTLMRGLTPEWVVRLIMEVGNYAEVYERNLGSGRIEIERGINRLWKDGGMLKPPSLGE